MKRKNFPGRKVVRRLKAMGVDINSDRARNEIKEARQIRTKKDRSK